MRTPLPSALLRLAVLAVLFSIPATSYGQSVWKYMSRYDLGASLLAYDLEYYSPGDGFDASDSGHLVLASYGANFGLNIPFKELDDKSSIGIGLGATLAVTDLGLGLFSVPVMAQYKFNNDATWKTPSGMNFGFSAGVGMQIVNVFAVEQLAGFTYYTPSIMAELNLGEKKSYFGVVKLRYMHNFGAYETGTKNDPTKSYSKFGQAWSVGLFFTPNY